MNWKAGLMTPFEPSLRNCRGRIVDSDWIWRTSSSTSGSSCEVEVSSRSLPFPVRLFDGASLGFCFRDGGFAEVVLVGIEFGVERDEDWD